MGKPAGGRLAVAVPPAVLIPSIARIATPSVAALLSSRRTTTHALLAPPFHPSTPQFKAAQAEEAAFEEEDALLVLQLEEAQREAAEARALLEAEQGRIKELEAAREAATKVGARCGNGWRCLGGGRCGRCFGRGGKSVHGRWAGCMARLPLLRSWLLPAP